MRYLSLFVLFVSFSLYGQTVDSTQISAFTVNTIPPTASVFSNQHTLLGLTPINKNITNELLPLSIEKEGFENLTLDHLTLGMVIHLQPLASTDFNYRKDKNLWFRSSNDYAIWYSVGGMVLSGLIASHYKLEASHQFRLYNDTKEARFLKKTNQYDTISAIGFSGLQISFGYLVYALIFQSNE